VRESKAAVACRALITSTKHTEQAAHFSRLDCPAHPRRAAGGAALSGVNSHRLGIAWRSIRYSLSSAQLAPSAFQPPSNQCRFMHLGMHTRCTAAAYRESADRCGRSLKNEGERNDETFGRNEVSVSDGGFVYRRLNRTPRQSRCLRISIINLISTLRAAREFRSRFRARAKTTTVNLDAPHCMKKFFLQEQRRALRLTRRQHANACFPINFTSTLRQLSIIGSMAIAQADSRADSATYALASAASS